LTCSFLFASVHQIFRRTRSREDFLHIDVLAGFSMYSKAGAWQEELLKRRKANTHKERRKEGRTCHTKSSKTAITIASLALIFNMAAVAMPQWRSSWEALIGYGTRRHWGLLAVQGRKMQLHHTMYENNCKWYGHLMLGNSCLSPICKWYQLKCHTYFDLCLYSYSAAFVILLAMLIHVLCLAWTCMLSTRSLRWAATWWPVCAFLHVGGSVFWIIITEGLFDILDEESWFPIPTPGAAFVLACIGGFAQCVCTYLGFHLTKLWPEVDIDDPSQFITDSEQEAEPQEYFEEEVQAEQPQMIPGPMAPMPPEAADGAPAQPKERQWYYQDMGGQEQGPFPTSLMMGWYGQGAIGSDLPMRRDDEDQCTPLGDGSRFRP